MPLLTREKLTSHPVFGAPLSQLVASDTTSQIYGVTVSQRLVSDILKALEKKGVTNLVQLLLCHDLVNRVENMQRIEAFQREDRPSLLKTKGIGIKARMVLRAAVGHIAMKEEVDIEIGMDVASELKTPQGKINRGLIQALIDAQGDPNRLSASAGSLSTLFLG